MEIEYKHDVEKSVLSCGCIEIVGKCGSQLAIFITGSRKPSCGKDLTWHPSRSYHRATTYEESSVANKGNKGKVFSDM